MEREHSRESQISAVLMELKKGGVILNEQHSKHLEEKLANARPGDMLNNEQFRITVDESGFTTELGNFSVEKEK
jgi:hypothetical protein